eukprot:941093-Prymnesium_polylepis.1
MESTRRRSSLSVAPEPPADGLEKENPVAKKRARKPSVSCGNAIVHHYERVETSPIPPDPVPR